MACKFYCICGGAAAARAASSLRQLADFYDDDYVNLGPTLALGVPIFCFFLAASVFLEAYVLSTATAHLAIFAVGSYVVFSTCASAAQASNPPFGQHGGWRTPRETPPVPHP